MIRDSVPPQKSSSARSRPFWTKPMGVMVNTPDLPAFCPTPRRTLRRDSDDRVQAVVGIPLAMCSTRRPKVQSGPYCRRSRRPRKAGNPHARPPISGPPPPGSCPAP
jgi:hypothetical protein